MDSGLGAGSSISFAIRHARADRLRVPDLSEKLFWRIRTSCLTGGCVFPFPAGDELVCGFRGGFSWVFS